MRWARGWKNHCVCLVVWGNEIGMIKFLIFMTYLGVGDGTKSPDKAAAQDVGIAEVWAGHQVVHGSRRLPILGELPTRTETFVVARVLRRKSIIELRQRACFVRFDKQMGTKIAMKPTALAGLPETRIEFSHEKSGALQARPWVVGWGWEDLDKDGFPGVTIQIEALLCGGALYVASSTTSHARGQLTSDGAQGKLSVQVKQRILGASNWCLRKVADESENWQHGRFVYRRVPTGSTCKSLQKGGAKPGAHWPVIVREKAQDKP